MANNILDYIMWRGDLSFAKSPVNEVDNLILCRLSYLPMDGIVSESFQESITVAEAADLFFADAGQSERLKKSFVIQKEDIPLFRALADSERFGALRLSGYANQIDYDTEKQFSCITIELAKDSYFLAFRGTDDTLVGWKEDFNMTFLPVVPAQLDAVRYLEAAAASLTGMLQLGGHSKGGNLAAYASVCCRDDLKPRIAAVYLNDSPGFQAGMLADERYRQIRDRLHVYVPQSSVVGMMLEHEEDYIVVQSTQHGLFQHDLYTWNVMCTGFVYLETVTSGSHFLDRTLKEWILQLDADEREFFINTLFEILSATNARTLPEMTEGWLKKAGAVINAYKQIDKSTKSLLNQTLSALVQAGRNNLHLLKPSQNSLRNNEFQHKIIEKR